MRSGKILFIGLIFMVIQIIGPANAQAKSSEVYSTPRSTIIIWTDGPKLKAVNITFFPDHSGPVGIVSVPLYTLLEYGRENLTVADYYNKYGRARLTGKLSELFGTPIETYVTVDQDALYGASEVIGTLEMAGVTTTLADIFEGRYVDHPVNLQVEIRQLAGAITAPAMLIKLPGVIWVVATRVDTNIGPSQMLDFYRLLKNSGPDVLQKKAVPGHDLRIDNRKYRLVEPEAWAATVKEVTACK